MDQEDFQLINYEKRILRVVRAKAKAGLQLSSYVRETDLNYFWGSQPAHTTTHKVQTQGAVKDHCGDNYKASKSSAFTPASTSIQDSELFNKAKKDKKKKYHRDKRDSKKPKDSTISASGVNAAKVEGKRRRNKKDLSGVTYYNCNIKVYFADKCLEPRQPKN